MSRPFITIHCPVDRAVWTAAKTRATSQEKAVSQVVADLVTGYAEGGFMVDESKDDWAPEVPPAPASTLVGDDLTEDADEKVAEVMDATLTYHPETRPVRICTAGTSWSQPCRCPGWEKNIRSLGRCLHCKHWYSQHKIKE